MFEKRTIALIFVALLVCDAMGAHMQSSPIKKSKGVTISSPNFRGVGNKHIANIEKSKVLVKKSKKSKGDGEACADANANGDNEGNCGGNEEEGCDAPVATGHPTASQTIFKKSWESVSSAIRTWQTITRRLTCIDTVELTKTNVDTITNERVEWKSVKSDHKSIQVKRIIHTHMNILKTIIRSFQTVVPKHVSYDTIVCRSVQIQTLTTTSISVASLVTKIKSQRVIKCTHTNARCMTSTEVSIRKVKQVAQEVSQSIVTKSRCASTNGGKSEGYVKFDHSQCKPVTAGCKTAVPSVASVC